MIINTANEELVLDYLVSKEELKYIITKISSYSLYAFEEEMRQGYITFRGGHRIGLAGQCVMENGRVKILRNISSITINQEEDVLTIILIGNGFMRYMVRMIVGTLIMIGLGKEDKSFITNKLTDNERMPVIYKAPPQGLYLVDVKYDGSDN